MKEIYFNDKDLKIRLKMVYEYMKSILELEEGSNLNKYLQKELKIIIDKGEKKGLNIH